MNKNRWGDWAKTPAPIEKENISEERSSEILVIGAGIAGLSCALSAAQKGAKVLCVEKFGKYTAEAVKTLQGRYGMEQTGVTSKAFLDKLYE